MKRCRKRRSAQAALRPSGVPHRRPMGRCFCRRQSLWEAADGFEGQGMVSSHVGHAALTLAVGLDQLTGILEDDSAASLKSRLHASTPLRLCARRLCCALLCLAPQPHPPSSLDAVCWLELLSAASESQHWPLPSLDFTDSSLGAAQPRPAPSRRPRPHHRPPAVRTLESPTAARALLARPRRWPVVPSHLPTPPPPAFAAFACSRGWS